MHVFEGETASEAWLKAATALLGDKCHQQPSRSGPTREILHAMFIIRDPRQRWVLARTPATNPGFAIAELIWILNGRRDSAFLNYWNSQLPRYAGDGPHYHGAYGYRLRQQFGVDQLERAYLALRSNPTSRQVALTIWGPDLDMPDEHGQPVDPDIPCNLSSLLKVRDGKLEWMQIVRSNDIFRGVPYNFLQFTTLQEVMAGWLGIEPGAYHHLSDSLHLYSEDAEFGLADPASEVVHDTDSLCLAKDESDDVLRSMGDMVDLIVSPTLRREALEQLVSSSHLPNGYHNMLLVLLAETARKKGWSDLAQSAMDGCSNAVLHLVWEKWLLRLSRRGVPATKLTS